jgi:hypothetical protein
MLRSKKTTTSSYKLGIPSERHGDTAIHRQNLTGDVVGEASEDLLELPGFAIRRGYGRAGSPTFAVIDPGDVQPDAMQPT